ncbi:histone H3-1-like [Wyeomyia smithii]|uniref:histone H3-1-like n=1 Tax=Wyeomyia smithii TaxID=174621 RepID=UPI002467F4CA|nr:histone H3-1-like [Wyeomyia smithii]
MPRRLRDNPKRIAGGLGDTASTSNVRLMPPPASKQAATQPKPSTSRSQSSARNLRSSSENDDGDQRRPRSEQRSQASPYRSEAPFTVRSSISSIESDGTPPRRSRSETRATTRPANRGQQQRRSQSERRNATRHLQEIRALQQTTTLLIPRLPFARVIREVLLEYRYNDLRITADALSALQESAEAYAVQLFEDSYRCTLHRERVTLMPKDMHLALYMRHGR